MSDSDTDEERTRAAMYAGMVAYSKEHNRLRRPQDTSRIDARCFLIGARAFIEAMKDDDDVDLIEDDRTTIDENGVIK